MENILAKIRSLKPLIHHITNIVTVSDCARITRYWGALPVMAYAEEEVVEMVSSASALVLNIGTLQAGQLKAMLKAGIKANQESIPVILDPVGAGATAFRTEAVRKILDTVKIAVIKGNPAEISVLAGNKGILRGVESVGEYSEISASCRRLAKTYHTVVVVSGKKDLVTDGSKLYEVSNGHYLLGQVVGTGCMLASTIAVFCSVNNDYLEASTEAVAAFGIASEIASRESEYPEFFKVNFMDMITRLDDNQFISSRKIKELN